MNKMVKIQEGHIIIKVENLFKKQKKIKVEEEFMYVFKQYIVNACTSCGKFTNNM